VRAYHEAEVEADDDGVGDGDGGELEVAEVSREGLRDDVHAVGDDAAEDGRRHDVPQLPRLLPHPRPELLRLAGLAAAAAALVAFSHHLPLLLHAGVQQHASSSARSAVLVAIGVFVWNKACPSSRLVSAGPSPSLSPNVSGDAI